MLRPMGIVMLAAAVVTAQPAEPKADWARGAVDPLHLGAQRTRFLLAAGVDSELSREEFEADAKNAEAFVRPFDRWEDLIRFDRNSNGTIDWFEAAMYREDVRARVLAAFDGDGNGRLTGAERQAANAALATGRVPGSRGAGPAAGETAPPGNGPARPSLDEAQRRRLAEESRARFEQMSIRRFDRNRDGRLDASERVEMERVAEDHRRQAEERRREFLARYDTDGDGQLSESEMRAARQDFVRRAEERRRQILARYDSDGDGVLSEQERDAAEASDDFDGF
jgi:hypothetical protein